MKILPLLIIPFLLTTTASADDNTNSVVSPAAPTLNSSQINKSGNVENDFFDKRITNNSPPTPDAPKVTPPSAPAPQLASKPTPPVAETLKMKPIVPSQTHDKVEQPKPVKKPVTAKTTTNNAASPFKKSQDANTVETVKKPTPQAEVKSQPLSGSTLPNNDGDITKEIEQIDKMGNEKPGQVANPATPNLPLSAIIGSAKTTINDENSTGQPLTATGESGLPVPRFVTFKSGEVNARTGPGENYPIRWLYQRKNLPVEITAEFKLWRRIKDFDGEESWVHHAMVSSRRYGIISRDVTAKSEADDGRKIANFKRGVQVKIDECKATMCEVQYGKLDGWVPKKNLWGVMADEVFH